jgi:hypothetical protein
MRRLKARPSGRVGNDGRTGAARRLVLRSDDVGEALVRLAAVESETRALNKP